MTAGQSGLVSGKSVPPPTTGEPVSPSGSPLFWSYTMNAIGHNSVPEPNDTDARLKSFVERIERLNGEKEALAADIREVFAEAKGAGFDVKAMRQVIRERKQDENKRQEFDAILDLYRRSLGLLADTPLGRAAEPQP